MMIRFATAVSTSLPDPVSYFVLWWGAAAAAIAFVGLADRFYREGVGRRRLLAKDLRRVVVGSQLAFVESLFGPASLQEQASRAGNASEGSGDTTVHTWVSNDHLLRCWVEGSVVSGWLVTSRNPKFRPSWFINGREIQLQKSQLSAVGSGYDEDLAMCGANWFGYMEPYREGGRPTLYQYVWVGVSEEGLFGAQDHLLEAFCPPSGKVASKVEQARRSVSVDTVSMQDKPTNDPLSLMLYRAVLGREQPTSVRRGRRGRAQ